jgi:predicted enzyme related to lactoylglutathione lyase
VEDDMAKHGEFNHIEFPANDIERAKAFYGAVFGWQFRATDEMPDYYLYEPGPGGLGGGIGKRGENAPDAVRNYIAVDSIDDSLATATANGGSVVVPKTDIGFGWYAAITDTEGNELGLYKSKSAD